jgi:xylan 1,4-beta-xylosidase
MTQHLSFIVSAFIVFGTLVSSCASQTKAPVAGSMSRSPAAAPKGAVMAGDYPDPSLIRVGDDYWAVGTSSAWAPVFPILHSRDLANWKIVSAVFTKPPAWSKGDYWAPEIANLAGKYFVYYSARNRKTSKLCLGVATAPKPEGPYEDHGPMVCGAIGSIDAAPFTDESGKLYLSWKEDGNSINKPTPIYIQEMDASGTKLVGKRTAAIVNDTPWERMLVEGPYILKRNGFWYLFYSGNACCGRDCNYAIGVARAENLSGPWVKDPMNPIVKGNEFWRCPGHGSIVQDGKGRDVLLYHGYQPRDFNYVGRQVLADQVEWKSDGWPVINNGNGPSLHAGGLLGATLRNEERNFSDDFSGKIVQPGWQWPNGLEPRHKLVAVDGKQELSLTATPDKTEAVLARSTTDGDYEVVTNLDLKSMSPGAKAALAAYGNIKNAIGISYREGGLEIWTREGGNTVGIEKLHVSDLLPNLKEDLWFKMTASRGQYLRFSVSDDGTHWTDVGQILRDAYHLPPWDLGIRVALLSQSGESRFKSFRIKPL